MLWFRTTNEVATPDDGESLSTAGPKDGSGEETTFGKVPDVLTALTGWSEAWNGGDLATYLNGYTDDARYVSESLTHTIMASEMAIRGQPAIHAVFTDVFERAKTYQAKQTTPKGVAGLLSYSEVTVQRIGDKDAVVFGHYCLELSDDVCDTGVFTLHVVWNEREWRIQSEHSSVAPKVKQMK